MLTYIILKEFIWIVHFIILYSTTDVSCCGVDLKKNCNYIDHTIIKCYIEFKKLYYMTMTMTMTVHLNPLFMFMFMLSYYYYYYSSYAHCYCYYYSYRCRYQQNFSVRKWYFFVALLSRHMYDVRTYMWTWQSVNAARSRQVFMAMAQKNSNHIHNIR